MDKSINLLESYKKLVNSRLIPVPRSYDEIDVTFEVGEGTMLMEYADIEYQALCARIQLTGGEVPFSDEEFRSYIKTLLYSRVAWVRNVKYIIHPNDPIVVPAFLSVVLMNIGNAEDVSLGVRLIPRIEGMVDEKGVVKPLETIRDDLGLLEVFNMRKISNYLQSVDGYNYSKGYIKDKSGVFDFMSMQVVENYIVHHNADSHPVYALMASILQPHMVASVLSPLVKYGSVSFLHGLLWEVTAV